MESKDHALAIAVLTEIARRARRLDTERRAELTSWLEKGDRVTARSPITGEKIGSVSLSDPKPSATVTDGPALDGWITDHYPEHVADRTTIADDAEAVAVLREHAPHLVVDRQEVPDWARAEVLRASEQARQPVGPGGELDVPGVEVTVPDGTLSYRASKDAAAEVERIVQAGLFNLADGSVRALPRGEAA